jgi:hypothetical protein
MFYANLINAVIQLAKYEQIILKNFSFSPDKHIGVLVNLTICFEYRKQPRNGHEREMSKRAHL